MIIKRGGMEQVRFSELCTGDVFTFPEGDEDTGVYMRIEEVPPRCDNCIDLYSGEVGQVMAGDSVGPWRNAFLELRP